MIDPSDVTKFSRTTSELEEFLLFCIIVAGKKATTQAKKLDTFLTPAQSQRMPLSPFQVIASRVQRGTLLESLKSVGMGQYTRLERVFTEILDLNLRDCSCDDLEAIKGIGPKTARYFLLHSRSDQDLAVLDRHILRWMADKFEIKTPANTPSSQSTYHHLERIYVDYCREHGVTPADLDLAIWNWHSNKKLTPGMPV